MNPIVIVGLVAAVGYGVYRFISRPVIEVERKPESAAEKGMKQIDRFLGDTIEFVGSLTDPYGFWGKAKLNWPAMFFHRIYLHRGKAKDIRSYFTDMKKKYGQAYYMATVETKNSSPGFGADGVSLMLRSIISELMFAQATINKTIQLFGRKKGMPIPASAVFTAAENKLIGLEKYNNYILSLDDNVIKSVHRIDANKHDFWKYSDQSINAFPIFAKFPVFNAFSGATRNQAYYFYSLFPMNRQCSVLMVAIGPNKKIIEFHQVKVKHISASAKTVLAKIAMFGDFNVIYQGFVTKFNLTGKTYNME